MSRSSSSVLAGACASVLALAVAAPAQADVSFAEPVSSPVAGELWTMAVADTDGDGRPDVIAPGVGPGFDGPTLGVLSTRANGTLRPYAPAPPGAEGAAVTADFNGDGSPDLATGSGSVAGCS